MQLSEPLFAWAYMLAAKFISSKRFICFLYGSNSALSAYSALDERGVCLSVCLSVCMQVY